MMIPLGFQSRKVLQKLQVHRVDLQGLQEHLLVEFVSSLKVNPNSISLIYENSQRCIRNISLIPISPSSAAQRLIAATETRTTIKRIVFISIRCVKKLLCFDSHNLKYFQLIVWRESLFADGKKKV
jgi:hypothetical protein